MTRMRKFSIGSFTIRNLNNKVFKEYRIPPFFVQSDASNNGLSSVYKVEGNSFISYKNTDKLEKKQSSTYREFESNQYFLKYCKDKIKFMNTRKVMIKKYDKTNMTEYA